MKNIQMGLSPKTLLCTLRLSNLVTCSYKGTAGIWVVERKDGILRCALQFPLARAANLRGLMKVERTTVVRVVSVLASVYKDNAN